MKRAVKQSSKPKSFKKPLAVVVSDFNETVTNGLLSGAMKALGESGVALKKVRVFRVAGAFELPLVAKKIAQSKKYAGVVALGCVIRGDTPHFEFVSLAATMGCLQAQMDTGIPVAFGVITVNTSEQATERSSDDQFNKGQEAVVALLSSIAAIESI